MSTALSFIRRWFHTNTDLAQDFVTAVATHTGSAVGPAGALARYLSLLGWARSRDGCLTLDGYLFVSLQYDSLKHIRHTLRQAWAYHLARQICHRKGVDQYSFAQTWHRDQFHQTKTILNYLADLNLEHAQLKRKASTQLSNSSSHDSTLDWGTLYRQQELYHIPPPVKLLQPTIHPAFITACVWGNR